MATKSIRAGLSRVALDLHLHTPASHDWKGGDITPDQFVARALDRGLNGIAITDHQSGEWIDRIKTAAEGTGLTVFPGVEIDFLGGSKGIHVIALFDTYSTGAHIDDLLTKINALNVDPAGNKVSQASTEGPLQVLDAIGRAGAIAVLAHSQSSKGVLNDMQGPTRREIVRHKSVLAVEAPAADFYNEEKARNHRRTFDFLNGNDPTYHRKLAVYQASDNPAKAGTGHDLEGIGSRFTYFYVESPPTLESLRQCFVDREMRIEIPLEGASPTAAKAVAFPHIKRVVVADGFLGGLELDLHSGMTTVLGAKGSAKSLLIELLRFALDQRPDHIDIRKDHDSKLARRLGLYSSVGVTYVDAEGLEHTVNRQYDLDLPEVR
jgi:PHP family Zn ribbon phosphoesterase